MNLKDMIPAKHREKGRWWGATITAVEGCTHVSPACDNCWAEVGANMRQHNPNAKVAARHQGLLTDGRYNGTIRLMYDDILKPLHRRIPTAYTWWNDLFHPDVPFEFINRCFAVMALTPQHVHIVCTKRAKRRYEYLDDPTDVRVPISHAMGVLRATVHKPTRDRLASVLTVHPVGMGEWPLPNVIQMTTAENQAMADERIPQLLRTPAAVRAVAIEPCLGPVDVASWGWRNTGSQDPTIDWVIIGGETGKGARPMNPDWARSVRDQCEAAGVPLLFKQWGPRNIDRFLDGKLHDGYPEIPEVSHA